MPKLQNTIHVNASPDATWAVVGDHLNLHAWIPGVSGEKMKDDARTCALEGVGELQEKISNYDSKKRSYDYEVVAGGMPVVKNYHGHFAVTGDKGGSLVMWNTEFDVLDASQEAQIVQMLNGLMKTALSNLKNLLESDKWASDKNKCVACECPCDMHKEHTHGKDDKGAKCMACECPCEKHKVHNHK